MAGGRSGGLDFLLGLFGITAQTGASFVSTVSEQVETEHYMRNSGFNLERQKELEKWARSTDPAEHQKFIEVYGRPLYRSDDWFNHDAIYYISYKEKWRYCEPEDYTGNKRPVYFSGSKSQWEIERRNIRAQRYLNLMPRLQRHFEWYEKYKDGTPFYTGIFPEEYETEDGYRRALEKKYPDMYKRMAFQKSYDEAEEKAMKGIEINQVAVELKDTLSNTENYDEYVDVLWRHFLQDSPTKNQIVAKVYAWILLNYKSIPEKNGLLKSMKKRMEKERMRDLDFVYKKSVSERIMSFKKFDEFDRDNSCAIGIDCMNLAWEYNTEGEKETLEYIKKKLTKIIGGKYVKGLMRKKFENKEHPQFSPIEIHKIF